MKRTCYGCKASWCDPPNWTCQLGYSVDPRLCKPLEDCPKPLTNMQLINAKHKNIHWPEAHEEGKNG